MLKYHEWISCLNMNTDSFCTASSILEFVCCNIYLHSTRKVQNVNLIWVSSYPQWLQIRSLSSAMSLILCKSCMYAVEIESMCKLAIIFERNAVWKRRVNGGAAPCILNLGTRWSCKFAIIYERNTVWNRRVNGGAAPWILNLGTRWSWVALLTIDVSFLGWRSSVAIT